MTHPLLQPQPMTPQQVRSLIKRARMATRKEQARINKERQANLRELKRRLRASKPRAPITPLQQQIVRAIDAGHTFRQIAKALGTRECVVSANVGALRYKTVTRTTLEMVAYVKKQGWV